MQDKKQPQRERSVSQEQRKRHKGSRYSSQYRLAREMGGFDLQSVHERPRAFLCLSSKLSAPAFQLREGNPHWA
eukprot:1318005-Pleurochrysis_carterae.AAC.1